jgi:hypothetical protein
MITNTNAMDLPENIVQLFYSPLKKTIIPSFEKAINYYHRESHDFLYRNRYVNRAHSFKIAGRVNAFRVNLQLNDVEATLYNELKTYLTIDTRLYKYHKTYKRYLPLSELGIKKRAFQPGWYKYKDLLYHTTHDMPYRNLVLSAKNKQLIITAFIRRVRPLNKTLMYKIISSSFNLSFTSPMYISRKNNQKSYFSMLYLGFKLWCHYKYLQSTQILYHKTSINKLIHNNRYVKKNKYKSRVYKNKRFRKRSVKLLRRKKRIIEFYEKRDFYIEEMIPKRYLRITSKLLKAKSLSNLDRFGPRFSAIYPL